MKARFHTELKKYLRGELLRTRQHHELSQEKMAPHLEISTRALGSVEDGESCPSLDTFLFFCYRFYPDPQALLDGIFDIIRTIEAAQE